MCRFGRGTRALKPRAATPVPSMVRASGQILPMALVLLTLATHLTLYLINTGEVIHQRVAMQATADATLLSAVRIQARALNALAILNQAIRKATTLSRAILITWATLAACASACTIGVGCACVTALAQYSRKAPRLLKRLQRVANQLAETQDRIIAKNPSLVASSMRNLARKNGADVVRWRYPHQQDKRAAYLGLRQGPPLYVERNDRSNLGGLRGCHHSKSKQERKASRCRRASSLIGGKYSMPGTIRLQQGFRQKQKLALIVSKEVEHRTVRAMAQATVQGEAEEIDESLERAFWDGKLEPIDLQKSFLETTQLLHAERLLH